jgi:hypothetical protein
MASANEDTLAANGRDDEVQHLTRRVRERLEEFGDGAPEQLVRLATQLGVVVSPQTSDTDE